MVAPRLAGISGGAVDTVCDTNQNRMVTYMSSYFEQTNRYPNKLTNLVMTDGIDADPLNNSYQIPVVSDQDPENGAEVFANEFYERSPLRAHILTSNEAAVLRNMGITTVLNLNDYTQLADAVANPGDYDNDEPLVAVTTEAPAMDDVDVAEGLGVAMVGMSADAASAWTLITGSDAGNYGEPDFFGRIVLGMGAECSLITSGVISNAAHCPGGIQNADNATYNDYNLVLPRLETTVDTFDAVVTGMDSDTTDPDDGVQLAALSYDEAWPETASYDIGVNSNNYTSRTFTLDAQENWEFTTMCPEGHMYPEDDGEFWAIDLGADGSID
ncbi:hypothetical protein [Desulfobacter hydrogenophilus]|nr:hypothetical protein [Desulfobacter hydrogenophilus]